MVRSVKASSLPSGRGPQPFIFHHSFIMAKGNMLLGFSRGSVGDLTFYRRNAQQVTRARARVVKNPKTLAQQMQRAIMRTSVEAYKVIKGICDHSWEGVAYGANSYAEFQKQNMSMLRRLAAEGGENTKSFLPSGFNGLVAMPWILSKGSIAWAGVQTQFQSGNNPAVHIVFNANLSGVSSLDELTYDGFCEAFNCQEGDQVTLIAFPKRSDIDESSCIEPVIARLILSPGGGDTSQPIFTTQGRVEEPNPLNENTEAFTFAFATGRLSASISGREFIGAAVIISRRATDGTWKRSSSAMEFSTSEQSGGYSLRQASMVVSTDIKTPSDWYLNNANEVAE